MNNNNADFPRFTEQQADDMEAITGLTGMLDKASKHPSDDITKYQSQLGEIIHNFRKLSFYPPIFFDRTRLKKHLQSDLARKIYLEYVITCITIFGKNYYTEDRIYPIYQYLLKNSEIKIYLGEQINTVASYDDFSLHGGTHLSYLFCKDYYETVSLFIEHNVKLTTPIKNFGVKTNVFEESTTILDLAIVANQKDIVEKLFSNADYCKHLLQEFSEAPQNSSLYKNLLIILLNNQLDYQSRVDLLSVFFKKMGSIRFFPVIYLEVLNDRLKERLINHLVQYIKDLTAFDLDKNTVKEAYWYLNIAKDLLNSIDGTNEKQQKSNKNYIEKQAEFFQFYLQYFSTDFPEHVKNFTHNPYAICWRPFLKEIVESVEGGTLDIESAINLLTAIKEHVRFQSESFKKLFLDVVANIWLAEIDVKNVTPPRIWSELFQAALCKPIKSSKAILDIVSTDDKIVPRITLGSCKNKHYASVATVGKNLEVFQLLDKYGLTFLHDVDYPLAEWPILLVAELNLVDFLKYFQVTRKIDLTKMADKFLPLASEFFLNILAHKSYDILEEIKNRLDIPQVMSFVATYKNHLYTIDDVKLKLIEWLEFKISELLKEKNNLESAVQYIKLVLSWISGDNLQLVQVIVQKLTDYARNNPDTVDKNSQEKIILLLDNLKEITQQVTVLANRGRVEPTFVISPLELICKLFKNLKMFEPQLKQLSGILVKWNIDVETVTITVLPDVYRKFFAICSLRYRKIIEVTASNEDQITFVSPLDSKVIDFLQTVKREILSNISLPTTANQSLLSNQSSDQSISQGSTDQPTPNQSTPDQQTPDQEATSGQQTSSQETSVSRIDSKAIEYLQTVKREILSNISLPITASQSLLSNQSSDQLLSQESTDQPTPNQSTPDQQTPEQEATLGQQTAAPILPKRIFSFKYTPKALFYGGEEERNKNENDEKVPLANKRKNEAQVKKKSTEKSRVEIGANSYAIISRPWKLELSDLQLAPWKNEDESEIRKTPPVKVSNPPIKPSKLEANPKSSNLKKHNNTRLFSKVKKIARPESANITEQDIFKSGLHHYQMLSSLFSEYMTINAKKEPVFRYALFFNVIRCLEVIGLNGYYHGKRALSVDDRLAIPIRDQLVHYSYQLPYEKLTTSAAELLENVLPLFQNNFVLNKDLIDLASSGLYELSNVLRGSEALSAQTAARQIKQIIEETAHLTKVIVERPDVNKYPFHMDAMKGCLVIISELYTKYVKAALKFTPEIFRKDLVEIRNKLVHVIGESNDHHVDNANLSETTDQFWLYEEVSAHDVYDMIRLLQDDKILKFLQSAESRKPKDNNNPSTTPTLKK